MSSRFISIWQLTVVALAVLVVTACNGSVEPCAGEDVSCEPRDLGLNLFRPPGGGSVASGGTQFSASPLEELLESGVGFEGFPVDIVARVVALPDSFRCDWHGYARTASDRNNAFRFWMNVDADAPLPTIAEAEKKLASAFENDDPVMVARLRSIIYGGLSDSDRYLSCSADYRVSGYILGDGPAVITVVYHEAAVASSYDIFKAKKLWDADIFGREPGPIMAEEQYESGLFDAARSVESTADSTFEGREGVLFLSPIAAQHFNIALEGWQVVGQWELQEDEDGTVNAVRYGAYDDDPEHTQRLDRLKSRVMTAAASDAASGSRIANISGLNQFYRDIGAYDDITPDDGVDNPFTPAQLPFR